jgi:hypothetical protein
MVDLVHVADASHPFDYSVLPGDVSHVLGYVGLAGYTPHLWTRAEVDACRAAGFAWHPIVTLPIHGLSAEWGQAAAAAMLAALPGLGVDTTSPVFLDIEAGAYDADPPGADLAVGAWSTAMRAAGYATCVPYLPLAANRGWVAYWTEQRPTVLPSRWQGWQYANALHNDDYDLSVFDPAIFQAKELFTVAQYDNIMAAIENDKVALASWLNETRNAILDVLRVDVASIVSQVTGKLSGLSTLTIADVEAAVTDVLHSVPTPPAQ